MKTKILTDRQTDRQTFDFLNLIKILSAIIIAYLYHYRNDFSVILQNDFPFIDNCLIEWLAIYGLYFTDLFFIISGITFCIAYRQDIADGNITLVNFIKKRIKKLYPLMFTSTFLMVVLEIIHYNRFGQWWLSVLNVWDIFISFIGVQTGWFNQTYIVNMPIWYISVLLQCYIIAFLLVRIISQKDYNVFIFCIPILLFISADYAGITGLNWFLLNGATSRGMQGFFVGILIYDLLQSIEYSDKRRKICVTVALLTIILIIISCKVYGDYFIGNIQYVLVYIVFPNIIFISYCSKIIQKVSSLHIIKSLATLSYSVYLFNLPTQLFIIIVENCFNFKFEYSSKIFWLYHVIFSLFVALIFHHINLWLQHKLSISVYYK